jgi:predicted AAA+ superfamily ATPase
LVITEILKSYYNTGISEPPVYFYRDRDKKEIDLIIDQNGWLYAYEIKQYADPTPGDLKNFRILNNIAGDRTCAGGVICRYEKPGTLKDNYLTIPVEYL